MTQMLLAVALCLTSQKDAPAWDVARTLTVDGLKRSYHFHLPKAYDPTKPTPLVLVLHGAATNGKIMEHFCGMTAQADKSGFIVLYPNGTGAGDLLLTWNAGAFPPALNGKRPNDIAFLAAVLDDVAKVANVDKKRTYLCGLSNGGMMTYRAAAEMSERFAAMASVAGTIVTDTWQPKLPMPVLPHPRHRRPPCPLLWRRQKRAGIPTLPLRRSQYENVLSRQWLRRNTERNRAAKNQRQF